MSFLWKALDYVPVVGSLKNAGEAVVAFVQGDSERGFSKTAEATFGGVLDFVTLGTGKIIATAVVKGIGKEVSKAVAKEAAVKLTIGAIAVATAIRTRNNLMMGNVNNHPDVPIDKQHSGKGGGNNQQNYNNNRQNCNTGNQRQTKTGGGKQPNQKGGEKNPPKRGHHIINNGIVKLIRNLIKRFILQNGRFSEMIERYITPNMRMYTDYYHPLPSEIVNNIANVMVVNPSEVLDDPNDNIYGNHSQAFEGAFIRYINVICNRENDTYTKQQEEDARNEVITLAEGMISAEVFIDNTAKQYWYKEDVNMHFQGDKARQKERKKRQKMFDEARKEVEKMLRGLVDKAEVWVQDATTAFESYNKK